MNKKIMETLILINLPRLISMKRSLAIGFIMAEPMQGDKFMFAIPLEPLAMQGSIKNT